MEEYKLKIKTKDWSIDTSGDAELIKEIYSDVKVTLVSNNITDVLSTTTMNDDEPNNGEESLTWKKFRKDIKSIWKSKKSKAEKYDQMYDILKKSKEQNSNFVSVLKADIESEIQVTTTTALLTALFTFVSKFLVDNFQNAIKVKVLEDAILQAILLSFVLIVFGCISVATMSRLKKLKFILCLIQDYEKDNK